MINLFETYNQNSWDLHYSLIVSGYNNPTISITDDGFLPEDVTSPFLYFTGFSEGSGRPLYFNEIPVPEFWEIAGNNSQGEILDYEKKRAVINYANPKHLRHVKTVDWLDEDGRLRLTDRYNKFGSRFAQTNYNIDGQATLTSYFNKEGQEVLTENHTTGDIILNFNKQVYIFKNRSEFVIFYLETAKFDLDRIFYNSLSTPFLVAYRLNKAGNDVLFWQESLGDQLPGNMEVALQKDRLRQTTVVSQDYAAYEKMQQLMTKEQKEKTHFLGFLYPFRRQNSNQKDALILTNSDQLENAEQLISHQTGIHFHIGAITEMSSKLMDLGRYHNVTLYPNISQANVDRLFQTCDIYLDINHGNEILSAIRTAFENRMAILAFDNTCHNRHYVATENTFAADNGSGMNDVLEKIATQKTAMAAVLKHQRDGARVETKKNYRNIIG
ncbi:accessory Sec system glycosylation chaperone GtfB [Streptococcus thoraltensis]|uniref:accessory Sec system glycosylation chaperone GtfB n=1 Tax=Streptococcus thoraltensis TaxID=55085 RepID=UPI0003661416|nr:accessory Sec system glycosylation chaperone GtfB [Streptococcus thoraltensis]MDY4762387.1 accessory Sec system glycosylation chaperone GtfB [Streptococcus thoraltensis]